MKAVIVESDTSLVWREVPDPVLQEGEVLLEVHAAALNRADILQKQGKYPPPPGWPEWMGLEVAGLVLETAPGVKTWKPGDPVCALLGGGGYAEKVCVPAGLLMPVPSGFSMEEAASLPEAYATAYLNLFLEAKMKRDETLLVHAGASGVGMAAIQLGKAFGARVVATVGSEAKRKAVAAIGADVVIDYHQQPISDAFTRCAHEGWPVSVVLDCLGGPELGNNLRYMAQGGRWVLIATLGGEETTLPLRDLLNKGITIIGSKLRNRSTEEKTRLLQQLQDRVWPKMASGDIHPVVYSVLPVEEVMKAHRILENRENIGKVVLSIQ